MSKLGGDPSARLGWLWVEGDDGKQYEVPAPVARKVIWATIWAHQIVELIDNNRWPQDSRKTPHGSDWDGIGRICEHCGLLMSSAGGNECPKRITSRQDGGE